MLFDTCKICLKSKSLTSKDRCLSCASMGKPAWNKGLKMLTPIWNKGKKMPQVTGKNHYAWKDDVSYGVLHKWVKKELGKAVWCEHCMSTVNVQWANASHQYRRDLYDWMQLCVKCHNKYDKGRSDAKRLFLMYKSNRAGRRIAEFA